MKPQSSKEEINLFEPFVSLYQSLYSSSRLVILLVSVGLAAVIVSLFASWYCILKKAGNGMPWMAFVPVLNLFALYNTVQDVPLLLATLVTGFLALALGVKVQFVGIVLGLITLVLLLVFCRHMAEAFGEKHSFALGLLVFSFVFYPILALSDKKIGAKAHSNQEVMDSVRAFLTRTRIINIICVALMILLVVLQWMPFWTYESAKEGTRTASIQQYIWTPTELTDLTKQLAADTGNASFSVEKIMLTPLFELILFLAGLVLCTWKGDRPLTALIPIAIGLLGVFGYLSNNAFALGSGWSLHFAVCVVLKDLGIVNLLMSWIRPEKRIVKKI